MNFLKPTKFTWFICQVFLVLNVSLFVLGFVLEGFGYSEKLFVLPFVTLAWLNYLVDYLRPEIVLTESVDMFGGPNTLGFILIAISTLSSFFLYYVIASFGNYFYNKNDLDKSHGAS